jgi:hypothetical protein
MRFVAAWRVLLLALSFASSAAAVASSRLVYARSAGAESCPDEEQLRAAVIRRLGYDPFFVSATKTIVATIAPDGNDLRGEVQLVDERGISIGLRSLKAPVSQCPSSYMLLR